MPETSQGQLAYIRETVAGTTPATPAFKIVDMTSEDLAMNVQSIRSAAVTRQRVVRSNRRAGRDTGGGFSFELYKGAEIDEMLEALLGNTFAGDPLTAKGGGTLARTYTFERKLSATDYRRFVGWRPGSMDFTVAPEAHIACRIAGVGYSMLTDNAIVTGATYSDPTDSEKLTALDVATITLANGLTGTFDFETISWTINNQLTARKRIGPQSTRSISAGQLLVTGSGRVYIPDQTFAEAFVADTHFDMDIPMEFDGEGYTALFKNVALTAYNDPNTGNNDEYMGNFDFEATLDSTFGSSFAISKTS